MIDRVYECRMCGHQEESKIDLQKHLDTDHEPRERREYLIMKEQPAEDMEA